MYQISKDLAEAIEKLLLRSPLEVVTHIWDAWRSSEHRKIIEKKEEGKDSEE
jgi:hypothetical protein